MACDQTFFIDEKPMSKPPTALSVAAFIACSLFGCALFYLALHPKVLCP